VGKNFVGPQWLLLFQSCRKRRPLELLVFGVVAVVIAIGGQEDGAGNKHHSDPDTDGGSTTQVTLLTDGAQVSTGKGKRGFAASTTRDFKSIADPEP
jgi:hypothetical protein